MTKLQTAGATIAGATNKTKWAGVGAATVTLVAACLAWAGVDVPPVVSSAVAGVVTAIFAAVPGGKDQ